MKKVAVACILVIVASFQLEAKKNPNPNVIVIFTDDHRYTGIHAGYHAHFAGKWHQDFNSLARSFNSGGKVVGKPLYLTDQFRMPFSDWQVEGNYKPENCYLMQYDDMGKVIHRPLTKDDKRGPHVSGFSLSSRSSLGSPKISRFVSCG